MSKNLEQVYTDNPITSNVSTDLMYFAQSPYGLTNDAGMTYANFAAQFGAPYTPAALSTSNDTNVTLTLGGTPTTALLHAASITAGWTGTLEVGRGGLGIGTTPTNGQIPIGNGTNYTAATLTPGTGISVTNSSGAITVASTGAGLTWSTISGTSQTAAINNGYIPTNVALTTITLPATAPIGSVIAIAGAGIGGWTLAANTGQTIKMASVTTTSAGSLTSAELYDAIYVICVTANTTWVVTTAITSGFTIA